MAREMKDSGIEWVETIPCSWFIKRIKELFSFGKGLPITKENLVECGVQVLSYGQIHSKANNGVHLKPELMRYVDRLYLNTNPDALVKKGDFIFADTSEDTEGCGNASYIDTEETLFSGYHTIIVRCKEKSDNRYFAYLFKTDAWRSQIRSRVNGVKLFSISRKVLSDTYLIFPPPEEQYRIADFLDRKCAEIDRVLEKTRASIEEYKKLKQSVITQAVTKGIRGEREMKDSGIEWIGEIPIDWEVTRIKNLFDYRNEKNFKPLSEVNLISLYTDLGVVQHCDLEATTGNKASNADGYKLVFEDDIVVNIILCWMGAIGRSAFTGVTSPAYDVYSPKKGTNSKFYHFLFRTQGFSGDCYKVGRGIMAMRWRTYSDQFRAIKVIAPTKVEQQEIVEYLDRKCAEIDTLISKKEQLITELEAYKKSLIYEYVTGKKEVIYG